MAKSALITGITGQDGSYLAEFLLGKDYEVHGLVRRTSQTSAEFISSAPNISHLQGNRNLHLHSGDLTDWFSLDEVVKLVKPDEVYNLAAQSHVGESFKQPETTRDINYRGLVRLIDSIEHHASNARVYQASTSELFGKVESGESLTEDSPMAPVSPYAKAKLESHKLISSRRNDGIYASAGILFNHESPRRGESFVTRKITNAFARIKLGLQDKLFLGNMDSKRDWGFAPDYVEAMWLMLQEDNPNDYIVSTGETHTIREFVEECAKYVDMKIEWSGEGINEKGINERTGKEVIAINKEFFRPAEVHYLLGDSSKAKRELGWEPKTKFSGLVKIMYEADFERLKSS